MHTEDGTHVVSTANDVMQRAHFVCDALEHCADPNGYFQLAASSLLVPPAALSEVVEAIEAYQSEPNLALKAVVPSLTRAERAIKMSLAVSLGQGNPEVTNYRSLAQGAVSREGNHGALTAYLKDKHEALSDAAGRAAKAYNEKSAYLLELSQALSDILRGTGKFPQGEKARAIRLSRELVATVADQGRTPEVFAITLSKLLRQKRNGAQAATALQEFVAEPTRTFQVAVIIDGTVFTKGLDRDLFQRIDPRQAVTWISPLSDKTRWATADMDLARFCLQHWGVSNSSAATYKHPLLAQALITKVQGWDEEQARHVALDRAEELVDKINAEHRTNHFGVKRKVMVWQEGARTAQESFPKERTLPTTRQMYLADGPSVSRSLRFASRAASERAGSMQVFFAWIALEYLGRGGNKSPQNLVAERAPHAVSLVELRHLLTLVWMQVTMHKDPAYLPLEVRQAIKRGDGKVTKKDDPNVFDMRKLLALIISDGGHTDHLESVSGLNKAEAEAAITAWTRTRQELSDYSAYEINRVRRLLRSNTSLQKYLEEVRLNADEALQRMRFVRNQTAHNAGAGSTEHLPLSQAALNVLDAVFEVLPQWRRAPYQALTDISLRWNETFSKVTSRDKAIHVSPFDPKALLRP